IGKRLASIEDPPADEDAGAASDMQNAAMSAFAAGRKLGETTGKACASGAGKSEMAVERVALDPTGKGTSSTVFLDGDAPAALRGCIVNSLAAAKLPVVPGMTPQPIEIDFHAR